MTKLTLTNLVNLQNQTTAVNAINANNDAIEIAIENTLSRDGTSPNQMESTFDMNSHQIINLPAPLSGTSPLRLTDASILNGGGTIAALPAGGTTGQALKKASNTDFDFIYGNDVSSVNVAFPIGITATGGPITSSGTISGSWTSGTTGTGANVFATSPVLVTPNLGTPSAIVLTNGTGLPIGGITGLAANVATFLGAATSANLAAALTDETGSGANVFGTSPTIGTAILNTPTINTAVASGVWTVSGTWTLPAATLGGTVSGGGNQLNNIIVGTTTPLAGTFTTLTANTSVSSPIHTSSGKHTFQSNGSTFAGSISTGQLWMFNANDVSPAASVQVTVSKNTTALATPSQGGATKTNVALQIGTVDATQGFVFFDNYGNSNGPSFAFRSGRGTAASPSATQSGDSLFNFYTMGFGSTIQAGFGAVFGSLATETWTDSAQGSAWYFYTNANGSTSITERVRINQGLAVGTTSDPGVGMIYTNAATFMIRTKTSYTNGAAAGAGTITNAPAAGNPTKWIPVDDNGTTRYVPAW